MREMIFSAVFTVVLNEENSQRPRVEHHQYARPYMEQDARCDGFSYNYTLPFVLFMSLMLVNIAEVINPVVCFLH